MLSRMGIHKSPLFIIDIDRHQIRPDIAQRLQHLIRISFVSCQPLFDQAHDLLHIPDVIGDGVGCLGHCLLTACLCRLLHAFNIKRKKVKSRP